MLIAEVKRQNKPYGLYFDEITGGYTTTQRRGLQAFTVIPLMVYRVFADGRPDELVRGVDIVGTPLSSFAKILATSDKPRGVQRLLRRRIGASAGVGQLARDSGFRDRNSEEAALAGSPAVPGPAHRYRSYEVKCWLLAIGLWLLAVARFACSAPMANSQLANRQQG